MAITTVALRRYLNAHRRPNTTNTNHKPGFIYVICYGSLHKIGLSLTPYRRVKEINPQIITQHIPGGHAIPTTATVLLVKYVPDMRTIEAFLHRQFRSKRAVPGFAEWLYLDTLDVDWIDAQINFEQPAPEPNTPREEPIAAPIASREERIAHIVNSGTRMIICRMGNPRIHFCDQEGRRTFCGLGTSHGYRHTDHLTDIPICPRCIEAAYRTLTD